MHRSDINVISKLKSLSILQWNSCHDDRLDEGSTQKEIVNYRTNERTESNYNRFSKIFLSLSIIFLIPSIIEGYLNFGYLGLIHSFNAYYFIGIFMILICAIFLYKNTDSCKFLILLQILILTVYLWIVPYLIRNSATRTSYTCQGFVDFILRNGFLNPSVALYHNWPGQAIFFAELIELCGINLSIDTLIGLTPFFTTLLCIFFVYLILPYSHNAGNRLQIAACIIFAISNYIGQDYYSPQGMAYLLLLILISICFKLGTDLGLEQKYRFILLIIIVFSSIVITHILTSIMAIFSIAVMVYLSNSKSIRYSFIFLAATIFVVWTIYGAKQYAETHLSTFLREALNLSLGFEQNVSHLGSRGDAITDIIVILFTVILYLLTFIGWLVTTKSNSKMIFTFLLLIPCTLPIIYSYNGEMVSRAVLFSLLPISFFISNIIINHDKKFLVIFFMIILPIFIPLHLIAHYGTDEYNYVPNSEKFQSQFLHQLGADKFELISENDPIYRYKNIENFSVILLSKSHIDDNNIITGPWSKNASLTNYAAITPSTSIYFNQFKNYDEIILLRSIIELLDTNTRYDCIYKSISNQYGLYILEGSK